MSTGAERAVRCIVGGGVIGPAGIEARDIEISTGRIGFSDCGTDPLGLSIDAVDLLVAPGLIDTQINGGFGWDFSSDPNSIWHVAQRLIAFGVTSFTPTIISCPPEVREAAMQTIRTRPVGFVGAEPIGLHFEGPMLNPKRRGAHDKKYLVEPSIDMAANWSARTGISMVTLAPELDGALEVIERLVESRVVVSLGHTEATSEQTRAAIDRGARHITHLFNANRAFHHREPGIVGAGLTDERITVGLICDLIHLSATAVDIAWRCKGAAGVVLVSDAVASMGPSDSHASLADSAIVRNRAGRVTNADGVISGSSAPLDAAIRNLRKATGASIDEVIATATHNPAVLLGRSDLGRLEAGARADVIVTSPDLDVLATIVAGRLVWCAPSFQSRVHGSGEID